MTQHTIPTAILLSLAAGAFAFGAAPQQMPTRPTPPTVERMPDGTMRLGDIRIDTAKHEISMPGVVNDVTMLEWVANTQGGMKAYESLLTLQTTGVAFNTAMLLAGVDPARSRVPTRHFDPVPPAGDAVEIWVDWDVYPPNSPFSRLPLSTTGRVPTGMRQGQPLSHKHVRIEQLLYDKRTNETLPEGPWVYTGSSFVPGMNPQDPRRYLADLDGVLIGFVHSPAPIIENPRAGAVGAFGYVIPNPKIGLVPGGWVILTIKVLDRKLP